MARQFGFRRGQRRKGGLNSPRDDGYGTEVQKELFGESVLAGRVREEIRGVAGFDEAPVHSSQIVRWQTAKCSVIQDIFAERIYLDSMFRTADS